MILKATHLANPITKYKSWPVFKTNLNKIAYYIRETGVLTLICIETSHAVFCPMSHCALHFRHVWFSCVAVSTDWMTLREKVASLPVHQLHLTAAKTHFLTFSPLYPPLSRTLLEQVDHWQSFLALVNMIMFCTGIPGHYPVNETTSSLTLTFWYTLQVRNIKIWPYPEL